MAWQVHTPSFFPIFQPYRSSCLVFAKWLGLSPLRNLMKSLSLVMVSHTSQGYHQVSGDGVIPPEPEPEHEQASPLTVLLICRIGAAVSSQKDMVLLLSLVTAILHQRSSCILPTPEITCNVPRSGGITLPPET